MLASDLYRHSHPWYVFMHADKSLIRIKIQKKNCKNKNKNITEGSYLKTSRRLVRYSVNKVLVGKHKGLSSVPETT